MRVGHEPGVGIEVEWEGGKQLVPPWNGRGDPGFKQPVPPWEWAAIRGSALPPRTTVEMVDWNGDRLQISSSSTTRAIRHFYERYRDEKGELRLKARGGFSAIPPASRSGSHSAPAAAAAGGVSAWSTLDGDGKLDILVSGTNAIVYRQVGEKDGNRLFRWQAGICDDHLAGHPVPTVVDFDANGIPMS